MSRRPLYAQTPQSLNCSFMNSAVQYNTYLPRVAVTDASTHSISLPIVLHTPSHILHPHAHNSTPDEKLHATMFFNRRRNRIHSDRHGKDARHLDPLPQAERPKEHRRHTNPRFDGGAAAAAAAAAAAEARNPHNNKYYPLYEQEQHRKGFQNPFAKAKSAPLGSAGKRAHVQGQERLPVSDYTGESNRADEPGTGWRLLQALNELRSRQKDRNMREDGGGMRQQGRHKGKERKRERRFRRRYSI